MGAYVEKYSGRTDVLIGLDENGYGPDFFAKQIGELVEIREEAKTCEKGDLERLKVRIRATAEILDALLEAAKAPKSDELENLGNMTIEELKVTYRRVAGAAGIAEPDGRVIDVEPAFEFVCDKEKLIEAADTSPSILRESAHNTLKKRGKTSWSQVSEEELENMKSAATSAKKAASRPRKAKG